MGRSDLKREKKKLETVAEPANVDNFLINFFSQSNRLKTNGQSASRLIAVVVVSTARASYMYSLYIVRTHYNSYFCAGS